MTAERCRAVARRSASAISAMMPPSPSLSARITYSTYLTVTTRIRLQKKSDSTPRTFSCVRRTLELEANAVWKA